MRISKFIVFTFLLTLFSSQSWSQEYNIGIRAGLNFGQYLGPQIPEVENYSLNNGFHFGINFSYNLTDFLALRGEILYNQNGTKYEYEGDGWYYFRPTDQLVRDRSNINLDISTGGVAIPISFHLTTLERWEFFGGGYVNFIFSSIGSGKWIFGPEDEFLEHSFEQGQFHNYRTDEAGIGSNNTFVTAPLISLSANGVFTDIEQTVGAYYLFNNELNPFPRNTLQGKRIRSLDYGFLGGVSYYLNRGLYLSLRAELGMRDMTNNLVDYSYAEINDDGSFIYSDDKDRTVNFALSLGFKF